MGQAVTTQAININQFSDGFPGCAVFVYGSHAEDGSEKTVEVRERTDAQVRAFVSTYVYDSEYGRPPEDTELAGPIRAKALLVRDDPVANTFTPVQIQRILANYVLRVTR